MIKKYVLQNKLLTIFVLAAFLAILRLFLNAFDQKAFSFENFKNIEDGQIFFEKYCSSHPNDYNYVIQELKKSGSKCTPLTMNQVESRMYKGIIRCVYNSGLFSLKPMVDYIVVIYIGSYDKISKIEFNKGYAGL